MLAAYGPSPGCGARDRDAEADHAFDRLLVIHRVAASADDVEVREQGIDVRQRPAGERRQLDPLEAPRDLIGLQ